MLLAGWMRIAPALVFRDKSGLRLREPRGPFCVACQHQLFSASQREYIFLSLSFLSFRLSLSHHSLVVKKVYNQPRRPRNRPGSRSGSARASACAPVPAQFPGPAPLRSRFTTSLEQQHLSTSFWSLYTNFLLSDTHHMLETALSFQAHFAVAPRRHDYQ